MKLKNRVQESMDEVEWDDKELEIDSDFIRWKTMYIWQCMIKTLISCMVKLPSGFTQPMEFLNDEVRRIKEDQKEWYVYDLQLQFRGNSVYIRGITSVTDAEESFFDNDPHCVDIASVDGSNSWNLSVSNGEKNIASSKNNHRDSAGDSPRYGFVKKGWTI